VSCSVKPVETYHAKHAISTVRPSARIRVMAGLDPPLSGSSFGESSSLASWSAKADHP